jgi:Zn-dependent protease with chaperone function
MRDWIRLASLVALACAAAAHAGPVLDVPAAPHNATQVREFASRLVAARLVRIEHDSLDGCERHCERLGRVFDRIAAAAREQAQRPIELRLVVVRDPATEAFSAPGGEIVISERFVDAHALTDAELAFVLAHEAMHVLLHHEAHAMALAAGTIGPGPRRTLADLYDDLDADLSLVLKLAPALHDHEFEADWQGLLLASVAGFDPHEQAGFLRKLARGTAPGLQLTHPAATRRLQRLDGMLPIAARAHALALARADYY